jgi:hypothetical protein
VGAEELILIFLLPLFLIERIETVIIIIVVSVVHLKVLRITIQKLDRNFPVGRQSTKNMWFYLILKSALDFYHVFHQ